MGIDTKDMFFEAAPCYSNSAAVADRVLLASKSCRNGAWNHNTKMIIYQDASSTIANLRYPAKNKLLCWLVDITINTKRLVRIIWYPSKIDLATCTNIQ